MGGGGEVLGGVGMGVVEGKGGLVEDGVSGGCVVVGVDVGGRK